MGRFLSLIFLCIVLQTQAQTPGEVTERITCRNNQEHSYALYLPSDYSTDKDWPVLFIYDAQGNGMAGIERFKKGAETYGYIVAGSYNYRNGRTDVGFEAATTLIDEVISQYAVDTRRLYTGGMSGGARMASMVAVVTGKISAVIAIGASFNWLNPPNQTSNFDMIGIAGDRDMNYLEMELAKTEMRDLGLFNHLIVYDGKHRWCHESQATEALQWLELLAMKKEHKARDQKLADEILLTLGNKADAYMTSGLFREAEAEYTSLNLLLQGWKENSFEEELNDLRKVKEFKKQQRAYAATLKKEERRQEEVGNAFRNIGLVMKSDSIFGWWSKNIQAWRKESSRPKNQQLQKSAIRTLGFVGLYAFSTASPYMNSGQWEQAIPYYKVAALINPEDANVNYFMAKIYALNQNERLSKRHLKKALAAGFQRNDGSDAVDQELLLDTGEFSWLTWRMINAIF